MKNNALITVVLIICLILLSYNTFKDYLFKEPKVEKVDTVTVSDTLYKYVTLTIDRPVPKYVKIVKRDTVYKNGKPIELVTENKTYNDTIKCAEDTAVVTSYISGVNPNLDSLKVKLSRREITKTNTITITKYITPKKKFTDHFKVGVGVGYGYGFFYKGVEPYIGVGGSFDL